MRSSRNPSFQAGKNKEDEDDTSSSDSSNYEENSKQNPQDETPTRNIKYQNRIDTTSSKPKRIRKGGRKAYFLREKLFYDQQMIYHNQFWSPVTINPLDHNFTVINQGGNINSIQENSQKAPLPVENDMCLISIGNDHIPGEFDIVKRGSTIKEPPKH